MARMTIETITEKLTAAKAEGRIWNVDFVEVKDALGRLMDKADREVRDALQAELKPEQSWELGGSFICSNYTNLPGRIARLEKSLKGLGADVAGITARMPLAYTLLPVCPLINEVKPLIIKGRKPAENPSVNARTIENTGTCGCCNRNIKLYGNGRIWDHGFEIVGRGRGWNGGYGQKVEGSCFGVGYEPIEVSNKVWIDMLAQMEKNLEQLPARIESLKASLKNAEKPVDKPSHRMTEDEKRVAEIHAHISMALRGARQDLRALPGQITEMKTAIAEWKPRALPGQGR